MCSAFGTEVSFQREQTMSQVLLSFFPPAVEELTQIIPVTTVFNRVLVKSLFLRAFKSNRVRVDEGGFDTTSAIIYPNFSRALARSALSRKRGCGGPVVKCHRHIRWVAGSNRALATPFRSSGDAFRALTLTHRNQILAEVCLPSNGS